MTEKADDPKPKRVCMVVHAYYPMGETRVEREALALADQGYEVDILCLQHRGAPSEEVENGVRIYRLPAKRYRRSGASRQFAEYMVFFFLVLFKLGTLYLRRKYCIVQVHNLPDFLVFAAVLPKLGGARLILDLHDLMPEFYSARFQAETSSWALSLVRWQERLSCRFADQVITVTEAWRQALLRRGVAPEKVTVVMNVADSRSFSRETVVKLPKREDSRLSLIYHGVWTYRYGLDVAVRAVSIVRDQIPGIHLTLHGGGDQRGALVHLVKELGLEQQVAFSMRFMPSNELPRFIRTADIGVVPYRRDPFTNGILPTKLMEYVALGLPVIASRTSAIMAYFDETMVEYCEPGDPEDLARCILEMHANRDRWVELVANSDRFNEEYSWPSVSAKYVALVERLCR